MDVQVLEAVVLIATLKLMIIAVMVFANMML
jgi:hypothetical protein